MIKTLRTALQAAADPVKAPQMQAYMKSEMPFYGISAPERRALVRHILKTEAPQTFTGWQETVLTLWREATHREERYAAIDVTEHSRFKSFQTMDTLPMYEEMIVTGAWWDYVDPLASHRLGALLKTYPESMKQEMRNWSVSDDLWKRRSAILCQLGFKSETDFELMQDCMLPSLDSPEFFLRKAIGWALRQYAYHAPEAVVSFVGTHEAELSPLSKREALRVLAKNGHVEARTLMQRR